MWLQTDPLLISSPNISSADPLRQVRRESGGPSFSASSERVGCLFDLFPSAEYQGRAMRLLPFAVSAALLASTFAIGQGPEPGSLPEQIAPPVSGAARPRSAVPPLNRADPNSPAQAGRNVLYKYLDDIAAKQTAERRADIARITTREQAKARQQEVRLKLLAL